MTSLESLNQALFLTLNADVSTPMWVLNLAAVAADDFIYAIPVFLAGLWFWGSMEQRALALKACAVAFISLGMNQLLGFVWPHPRPFMLGLGHTFIAHASDSSFPSDHATVFAAVGLTLILADARSVVGWVTLVLGVCVAWARIFLGVHFPGDMAGAVAVVAVVWMAIHPVWRLAGERVTLAASRLYRTVLARPIASGWIRP